MSTPQAAAAAAAEDLDEARPPYPLSRPRLPPNFPAVLKEYAREVLRAQPHDILEWSAEYFKQLALQSDLSYQHRRTEAPPRDLNVANTSISSPVATAAAEEEEEKEEEQEEVVMEKGVLEDGLTQEKLLLALVSVDESHTGVINVQKLLGVLSECFKLSSVQYLFLLTAPSVTAMEREETIDYESFVQQCAFLLPFLHQVEEGFKAVLNKNPDEMEVHGMSREDLESEFGNYFYSIDKEFSGVLSWGEYCNAILDAPIPLTDRDVRIIYLECKLYSGDYGEEVVCAEEIEHLFDRLILSHYLDEFDSKVVKGG